MDMLITAPFPPPSGHRLYHHSFEFHVCAAEALTNANELRGETSILGDGVKQLEHCG